ncbi:DMT family transporter [Collimonas silvisoli]|uniref:DMT family transporter n=1 Tax=Collimonas silvisoli TaxID=2825884 RepID=UPI001B8C4C33|nr:DMT family transporter [Collimonas silvisoli]
MHSASLPTASRPAHRLLAAMPIVFVLLWSTGFVVAKFGLPYAPPLTFLLLRFVGVLLVLLPLVLFMRAPWPSGRIGHIAFAGILLQGGYLAGVWCAIKLGMPAGVSALIVGMQPILTAFAAPLIGESVRPRQWLGLLLGICGVGLVVAAKITLISITFGTLYQKRKCPHFDLRTGTIIQFAASIAVLLPFAIFYEHLGPGLDTVQWTPRFIGALLWSILALSIGAIFLLFALIRKSAATRVTSLLYLTPPTTALMAWLMFGEVFSLPGMVGMALAILGVFFVMKR